MARGARSPFDELTDADLTGRPGLWFAALNNLRSNIMPPLGKPRPSPEEQKRLTDWIKYSALGIDPADPDPGRVTIRRLNRVEYGRTVRALLGVDYPSEKRSSRRTTRATASTTSGTCLSLSPLLLDEVPPGGRHHRDRRRTPELQGHSRRDRERPGLPRLPTPVKGSSSCPRARTAGGPPAPRRAGRSEYSGSVSVAYLGSAPQRIPRYRVSVNLAAKGPLQLRPSPLPAHHVSIDGPSRLIDEAFGWYDHQVDPVQPRGGVEGRLP